MSIEAYARDYPFKAGIAGNILASAIWAFGGKVTSPLTTAIGAWFGSGVGFTEWLHDLGWLFFLLALTNWFMFGRVRVQPDAAGAPIRFRAPAPRTPTITEKPIAAPVQQLPLPSKVTPEPSPATASGLLTDVDLVFAPSSQVGGVFLLVKNPQRDPISGQRVWVEDIQKHSETVGFRPVPQFYKREPVELPVVNSSGPLFHDAKAKYVLAPTINQPKTRLMYKPKGKGQPDHVELEPGVWFMRARLDWDGRSRWLNVAFAWEGSGKAPALIEPPSPFPQP